MESLRQAWLRNRGVRTERQTSLSSLTPSPESAHQLSEIMVEHVRLEGWCRFPKFKLGSDQAVGNKRPGKLIRLW